VERLARPKPKGWFGRLNRAENSAGRSDFNSIMLDDELEGPPRETAPPISSSVYLFSRWFVPPRGARRSDRLIRVRARRD